MRPLYKYIHARDLVHVQRGSFRIGTLAEYRRTESYGNEIGDKHEGMISTRMAPGVERNVTLGDGSLESNLLASVIARGPKSIINITLGADVRFHIENWSNDVYVFSTSSKFDPSTMDRLGYDACVEIHQPERFFIALDRSMQRRGSVTYDELHEITYRDKNADYLKPHTVHPALIKDPRFEYQAEFRALWTPVDQPIEPIIIEATRAARYLEVIARPR
jgi:hypothetical protein